MRELFLDELLVHKRQACDALEVPDQALRQAGDIGVFLTLVGEVGRLDAEEKRGNVENLLRGQSDADALELLSAALDRAVGNGAHERDLLVAAHDHRIAGEPAKPGHLNHHSLEAVALQKAARLEVALVLLDEAATEGVIIDVVIRYPDECGLQKALCVMGVPGVRELLEA